MEWKVFCRDFHSREIILFNIFEHVGFRRDFRGLVRTYNEDQKGFSEELRLVLMHYFWCKTEYEVVVYPYPCNPEQDQPRLVDAFWQINCNWAAFADYVWEHRKEVKPHR